MRLDRGDLKGDHIQAWLRVSVMISRRLVSIGWKSGIKSDKRNWLDSNMRATMSSRSNPASTMCQDSYCRKVAHLASKDTKVHAAET